MNTQAEAAVKLNREPDMFKMHLSMIILYLHQQDHPAAQRVYQEATQ